MFPRWRSYSSYPYKMNTQVITQCYRKFKRAWLAVHVTQAASLAATNTPAAIPWNEIDAKAGANYKGDGLAVTPTGSGARLHSVFQRLDGEATPEGLWLAPRNRTIRQQALWGVVSQGRFTPYIRHSKNFADFGEGLRLIDG